MACMSQFFILSPRGDTIISREYRMDVPKNTAEIFFRKVKFWKPSSSEEAPPAFQVDGISYIYMKQSGIYFMCTTRYNVSPSFILEVLHRLSKCFKDYCGVLSEEALRKNFVLIYELLDEAVDDGYPQDTSTESLKAYVYNEPVVVAPSGGAGGATGGRGSNGTRGGPQTMSAMSVNKPVVTDRAAMSAGGLSGVVGGGLAAMGANAVSGGKGKKQRNEIFVDIVERLTVLFNSDGFMINSEIDGSIQMKSFLSGNPELRLALNEDLVVGKQNARGAAGAAAVVVDDCNFHECVELDEFENLRTLRFTPPEGEFVVMNYRMTSEFIPPFRVRPYLEEVSPTQIDLRIVIQSCMPEKNYAGKFVVSFPVPKTTNGVSTSLGSGAAAAGQDAEYKAKDNMVYWTIKKFQGGVDHTLKTKIMLREPASSNVRRETGPISLSFEIPLYNVSNLQIRYLRIAETHRSYNPYRWVRYVTHSSSYVCRLT